MHPQDDAGKWRRLAEGRIIRAPVPVAMTPILTMETSASPDGEVWRISTRRDPLRLRSGTGTNYTILTKDFLHGHAFERSLLGAVLKFRREADIPRNDTGNILDCREAWQYQAAPTFAYIIGDYTLDRQGILTGPRNDYPLGFLAQDGYQTK